MLPLTTSRLTIRALTLDDAPFIRELVNEPAWLQFIGDKHVRSLDDARRYLRDGPLASYARHGFGLFAVELTASRELLGLCGLLQRDTLPDVDLGFAFLARHAGRGYAFESAQAVRDHGFHVLGRTRLVAITTPDNVRSQRLLAKLGFHFERPVRLAPDAPELHLFAGARAPGG